MELIPSAVVVVMEEDQLVKLHRMEMVEMELHQQVAQVVLVEMEVHMFMRSRMELLEDNFMAAIVVILMVEEEDLVTMGVVVVPHSFSQELVVQVIQED